MNRPTSAASIVMVLIAVPALAQQPVSDQVPVLVEQYAKTTLIERGYSNNQPSAKDRLMAQGLFGEAMEHQEPAEKLDELIESATEAPVGCRRQPDRSGAEAGYGAGGREIEWNFRNNTEKERKILELNIRKRLLPKRTEGWHEPQLIPLRFSQLQDGAVVTMSTIKGFEAVDFEERIDSDTIHVYARTLTRGSTSNFDVNRFAIHGLPKAISESLEVGRQARFVVLIHGIDKYQSVTGERSLVHLDYVPDELLKSVYKKLVPPDHWKEQVDRPTPEIRTWTSIDGKYRIDAHATSVSKDAITLHKTDGSDTTVPLSKLSRKDVEWAKAYEAALGPLEVPSED